MHIETLKIFCDVARLRSFSRSAEVHNVTQSAASQAVHQLESRLGVTLIDRSRRPWTLTPAGKQFYDGCRGLIDQYGALERRVSGRPRKVARVNALKKSSPVPPAARSNCWCR